MIRQSFNDNWHFKKIVGGPAWGDTEKESTVTLPHDAMILEPRDRNTPNGTSTGFYPGGTYTYSKTFDASNIDQGQVVYLEFEGVYMNAMVYINGDLAGKRPYGYSRFAIMANDYLRYGAKNEVKVVVQNAASPNSRWYSGSGLYRPVNFVVGDSLHVALDGLKISTESVDRDYAVITIDLALENTRNANRSARLKTVIKDSGGRMVAADQTGINLFGSDSITIKRRIAIPDPDLWHPDTPNLYTCVVEIEEGGAVIDQTTETFGVRTLQLDAQRGLRVNGSSVKLRGTCIHHDNGVIGAATLERAEERRVEIMKDAGFNAIRSAHHPMSKALLRACDRLGMLVMDEAFDMWHATKSDFDYALYFDEWWERDIESMVAKDYNHPCVVMYSIGNEIPELGTPKGARLNRQLADKVRTLDPTRYVTNAINGVMCAMPYIQDIIRELAEEDGESVAQQAARPQEGVDINQFMMDFFNKQSRIATSRTIDRILEETADGLDIVGYNYMVSRYDTENQKQPNRVVVGSETFPEHIGLIWRKVMDNSHVIGDFTWTGWDYLGEAGIGAFGYDGSDDEEKNPVLKPYPAILAYCGDIDITGHRRPMSYLREIVFGLRQAPYIAVQRVNYHGQQASKTPWSGSDTVSSWTWPGYEGQPAVIEVYASAREVELIQDGRSLGRKTAGDNENFTAVFETTYKPGKLEAIGYSDGLETGRMLLATDGEVLGLKVDADRTDLRADSQDMASLMISLTDSQGAVNMAKPLQVSIQVEGPGILQGFGSADPMTTENYFDTVRTTYDGRVFAVIRTTQEAGKIRVSVSAPGCDTETVVLNSKA